MQIIAARASENVGVAFLDVISVAEPVSLVIEACGITVVVIGGVLVQADATFGKPAGR